MKRVEVSEIQRALVIANGRIKGILEPGRHWFLNPFEKVRTLIFDVNRLEFVCEWTDALLRDHPELASKYFEVVDVNDKQIAIVYQDGKFMRIVPPGQKAVFWKVFRKIKVELVDFHEFQEIDPEKAKIIVERVPSANELYHRLVPENHVGLLVVDGILQKSLPPGSYTYWKGRTSVEMAAVDLRIQNMEVSGQEILTKDRVTLRINFEAYYKIVDAVKALREIRDLGSYLHKEFQFALRHMVGSRTLDEVLSKKDDLNEETLRNVRPKVAALGVEIVGTGIKDIILPGDIREILNEVVSAEKAAQANLIRRREEVAATRSLLNTAKIIESNPIMMRLKEMETLERVSEKIQSLNVVAGVDGVLGRLTKT